MHIFQHLLCFLVLGWVVCVETANGQITTGTIRSVYLLKFGPLTGTCFNLSVDEKQYLITAAHVVKGIKAGDKIGIYKGDAGWEEFNVIPIAVDMPQVDIIALLPKQPFPNYSLEVGAVDQLTSHIPELYFMGFPYGGKRVLDTRTFRLSSTVLGSPYPGPLIKRGIMAGMDNSDPSSLIIFIDAMNNPGFSGAPVLFYDKSQRPKVIGVVSSRVPEELMTLPGVPAPPVGVNSGIVISHEISSIVKAIRDHNVHPNP